MNTPWQSLYWQDFQLVYQAREAGYTGTGKASAWRGLLGHALRAQSPASYGRIFENRISPDHPYARRYRTGPVPYICRIEESATPRMQKGELLTVRFTLIGKSLDLWQDLLPALRTLGGAGIGRDRVVLRWEGFEALDGGNWNHLAALPAADHVDLTLATPLVLGKPEKGPPQLPLATLVRRLAERAMLLAHFFCEAELEEDFEAWTELAAAAYPEGSTLFRQELSRYSSRQAATLRMKGLAGQLSCSHISPDLAPLLRLGRYIHLGKGTPWGLGEIHCNWKEAQTSLQKPMNVRKTEQN